MVVPSVEPEQDLSSKPLYSRGKIEMRLPALSFRSDVEIETGSQGQAGLARRLPATDL